MYRRPRPAQATKSGTILLSEVSVMAAVWNSLRGDLKVLNESFEKFDTDKSGVRPSPQARAPLRQLWGRSSAAPGYACSRGAACARGQREAYAL